MPCGGATNPTSVKFGDLVQCAFKSGERSVQGFRELIGSSIRIKIELGSGNMPEGIRATEQGPIRTIQAC